METYLPFEDFERSAKILEAPELYSAMSAGMHFLNVIHEKTNIYNTEAWRRHPGVNMWRGYEVILYKYLDIVLVEFGKHAWNPKFEAAAAREGLEQHLEWATSGAFSMDKPRWLGLEQLHLSHQAELVRRNPFVYARRFPDVDASLPMVWPIIKEV